MQEFIEKYGEDLFTSQLDLEEKFKTIGEEETRTYYERVEYDPSAEASATNLGQRFLTHEFDHVTEQVNTWLTEIRQPKRGTKQTFINLIDYMVETFGDQKKAAEIMVVTSFSNILSASLRKETHHNNLARIIGEELEHETRLERFCKENAEDVNKTLEGLKKRVQGRYRRAYLASAYKKANFEFQRWDAQDRLHFAMTLIQVICKAGSYFQEEMTGKEVHITPTPKFRQAWSQNVDALVSRAFKFCPTIIPPKEWTSFTEGAYYGELTAKARLLRMFNIDSSFRRDYLARLEEVDLNTVLSAVNSIQKTPWKINKKVLEVAQSLVELGGGRAGIPLMESALPPAVLPSNPTESEIQAYKKKMVAYYRSENRRNSLRLRTLAALRVASEFVKYDRFYVPHNMDFRGRIYPIPTFSFQGDDLTKGLMEFADVPGIPTDDPSFLRHFYIEGANRAGVDKVSFDDRVKWVEEHKQDIISSAQDPIGYPWWQDQDCPFQFLAWCIEYDRSWTYMREHNGSIEGFQTGIVISFDGTCSGLQHFSAALRDPIGGQAVNLLPGDKPSDIYGIVAQKVAERVKHDCINGTEDEDTTDKDGKPYRKYGTKTLALVWSSYGITRKVTKRSVMTLAYGSKEYGFKEQLLEDIIKPDIDYKGEASVFSISKGQSAKYLAKLIWQAVQTTVVKAVEGMKWLQECASIVAKEGKVVSWLTPAGLPVQQHYLEQNVKTVQVRCAGKRVRLYLPQFTGNIDKTHQRSGIAPNFIHSLDAAHLQLTVDTCRTNGMTHFAMVHDSYGTCLAHAGLMFRIVREEFVNMYETCDVLENFREDMQELTTHTLPEVPSQGTLDLQKVLRSDYIFC